jgi:hypothetical protein
MSTSIKINGIISIVSGNRISNERLENRLLVKIFTRKR